MRGTDYVKSSFIIASLLSLAVALSQFWRQRDFEYSCAQAKRRQRARQQGKGQEMLSRQGCKASQ